MLLRSPFALLCPTSVPQGPTIAQVSVASRSGLGFHPISQHILSTPLPHRSLCPDCCPPPTRPSASSANTDLPAFPVPTILLHSPPHTHPAFQARCSLPWELHLADPFMLALGSQEELSCSELQQSPVASFTIEGSIPMKWRDPPSPQEKLLGPAPLNPQSTLSSGFSASPEGRLRDVDRADMGKTHTLPPVCPG